MKLKELFGNKRIVGYAGNRNSGKTNNLIALIKDFRKSNKTTEFYVYGLDRFALDYLNKFGKIYEISSLDQLVGKRNCIFIIDEFQKLHLSDKRYKDLIDNLISMIYHPENNNYLILCSPSLREFNSVIGSRIERWAVKSIKFSDLVNGSPLKDAVRNYQGNYKQLNDILMPYDKLLVFNDKKELIIHLKYVKEADTKRNIKNLFLVEKKKSEKKS